MSFDKMQKNKKSSSLTHGPVDSQLGKEYEEWQENINMNDHFNHNKKEN